MAVISFSLKVAHLGLLLKARDGAEVVDDVLGLAKVDEVERRAHLELNVLDHMTNVEDVWLLLCHRTVLLSLWR